MPELPEVEVTRLSFVERIRGARVVSACVGKPLRWPLGCAPESLQGRSVADVSRRGKYLWLSLDQGGLLLHLGMSGSLRFDTMLGPPGPHDHFDLHTSRGVLRLHDPRRFGAVVWGEAMDRGVVGRLLAGLGREPFDTTLNAADLRAAWRGRRASIKSALLAGDVVVGVGNIYACEALFAAGINPRLPAGRLSLPRCERLLAAIRQTLLAALEAGGSTLRDYRNADGASGYFQLQAQVYGRAGQDCGRCGATVRLLRQGQRSTYFCAACQPR